MQPIRKRWSYRAACKGDERFIQEKISKRLAKDLKQICSTCPVAEFCLNYAIVHESSGFYAGLNEHQIAKLRQEKLTDLAYQAISQGWLENKNLVPQKMLDELTELHQISLEAQRQVNRDLRNLGRQKAIYQTLPELNFQIEELTI